MKYMSSYFLLAFTLVAFVLGGCTPTTFTVSMEVPTLLPTPVPAIYTPTTETITYNPIITISPTSGDAGTLVQVVASGFMPNTSVSVAMGPVNAEFGEVAQGVTDANGVFITQVPAQGEAGMNLVFAITANGQPGVQSSNYFHIMEISQPVVNIAPTSGEAGMLIQVAASGFAPNTPVSVGMGPANSGFGQVAQGTTDGNGVFITHVTAQGSLGMHLVIAVAVDGEPGVLSSQQFQITGAVPNPPPIPPTPTPYLDMWTVYSNPVFAVSLEYPSDWQAEPGYGSSETGDIRFGGITGFFHINAMDTDTIDMAVASEAGHILQPYGPNPTIESLQIQGQEARLIMPSAGQQYQAAIIVRYPQPVNISGTPCRFFILWADQAHIRTIAQTIQFNQ